MDKHELYNRAKDAIADADEEKALKVVSDAQKEGFDLLDLLLTGFGAGNDVIGERFDKGAISLPELIYASEVMKVVTDKVLDLLEMKYQDSPLQKGKILLATVEGDIHDIGKGIVTSTLRAAGFDVIDMGCDVPVEEIIEEAHRVDADIIGTSALLTSTMNEQKRLEKLLKQEGEENHFMTMVGGAPCTPRWAKKIGADGYSEDALEAVRVAIELMEKRSDKK